MEFMKNRHTVVVTGSARRLGREIALSLAEAGFSLILHSTAQSNEAANTLSEVRAKGVSAIHIAADLNQPEEAAGIFEKIFELKGYVKHHQVLEYLFASDLLLLIIPDVKNNEGIIPGKLFEYLASHKQILCLGPKNGDAAKVIAETESGIICDYSDYKSITAAMIKIYNQKKSNNNLDEAKILKYSRKNLTSQLITVLKSL